MKFTLIALMAFSVAVTSKVDAANVLVNGGFETGDLTGWTTDAGIPQVLSSNTYSITPFGDFFFFAGQDTSTTISTISQLIDISAFGGDIDAGNGRTTLTGALGSWVNSDIATVTVSFLDGSSVDLGSSISISALDNPGLRDASPRDLTLPAYLETFTEVNVPLGTRTLSVVLTSNRVIGAADNDGYADNLAVDFVIVPEPSKTVLLGLGFAAMLLRRRR